MYVLPNVLDRRIVELPNTFATDMSRGEDGNANFSDFRRTGGFSCVSCVCIAYYSVYSASDRNRPCYQLLERL